MGIRMPNLCGSEIVRQCEQNFKRYFTTIIFDAPQGS